MADEKTKQQILDIINDRKYFRSKKVAKELNISSYMVSQVFRGMEKEGLIERWNTKQWTWVET